MEMNALCPSFHTKDHRRKAEGGVVAMGLSKVLLEQADVKVKKIMRDRGVIALITETKGFIDFDERLYKQ